MNFFQRMGLSSLILFMFLIVPMQGFAEPMHLFLDATAEAVARVPLEIEILVLDEEGNVETAFEGKKELSISVQEGGMRDESYSIRSHKVRFKKGKSSLSIEDSEEETLDLDVAVSGTNLSGQISLSFLDKDVFPPEVVDVFEEDPGILKIVFNEELEEESAQETRNYKAVTNRRETNPIKIEYHRTYVYLEFEEHFLTDEEGYLELEGIQDVNGNEISSGLRSSDFEGTCEDACPD